MMKLCDILKGIEIDHEQLDLNIDIEDIVYDSRKAKPNTIFVCISGYSVDGHDYAIKAYENGSRIFVAEKEITVPDDACVLFYPNNRKFLALSSANFFGNPADKLTTIAITGTKGKTSVSFMLKSIFEANGSKVGIMGSTGTYIGSNEYTTANSTPESYLIHKYYRKMLDEGCDTAIIEATSQGFKLDRTFGIHFDIGVFTNLSPDHIGKNEHKDFNEYLQCKKMIFNQCDKVIVNNDTEHFGEIIDNANCPISTIGSNENSDLYFNEPSFSVGKNRLKTIFTCHDKDHSEIIDLNTPGYFSLYNALAAIAVARNCNIGYDAIKEGLSSAFVKGRMEIVPIDKNYTVIIDFAHNEFSVKNLFDTIKLYNPSRIISVFGCGGNRSKLRRYSMGEVIGNNSDLSIITSDNSRFEKVEDIINDILVGMHKTNGKYTIIPKRKLAIKEALRVAKEGDVILLIGKGHEMYEEIEGIQYPFDEREEVFNSLNELQQQDD